ncbi:MAG TPA: hypothetical protein VKT82_01940 [Ktedonobacterales bacterium]|nr:hypothetical protein [Ktedonobacterales bacterium]
MSIRLRRLARVIWPLLALLCLAACAPGGNGSGATTPTPGSADLNGCAAQQPPAGVAGKSADLIVTQGGDYTGLPVALRQGQTLEVRLPATIIWRLQQQDAAGILTTNEATGWYDATLKDCLWRFTAVKTGSATLSFSGGLVCPPNAACPAIAAIQQYNVTVR